MRSLELSPLSSYHGSLVLRVLRVRLLSSFSCFQGSPCSPVFRVLRVVLPICSPVLRVLLLSENLVTLRTKEKNGKNRRTLRTRTQRTLEQENDENRRMLRTREREEP